MSEILTQVKTKEPIFVFGANQLLPECSTGTIVEVWSLPCGSEVRAMEYEVEFTEPFPCLITLMPSEFSALE